MSRTTALARGRAMAEAGMTTTCTITRVTGETTNPVTAVITPTTVTVYSGKCRMQQRSVDPSQEQPGQAFVRLVPFELQLPVTTSTGIRAEDLVTVTASEHDPDLVGRTFRVTGLAHKEEATARRIRCEEVTS